ncbi:translation initiation factor IF-2-like [Lutra lutra]|uniref:translation initiation factor IF-2-like n=1 Tax=Lutra lutra TaxID=9657 RepID=UPI001FCF7C51|nr:translation initiation factor IF-2-like [Lutra lutra]
MLPVRWKRGLGLRSILGHCAVPSGLWTPKRPLGWGRKNSGAIRRFFPKARGFAAQDIHCQAGALRRAATVRVPLDGVRWTEAPRGRPCPGQGARAGRQDRSSPPSSCGPPVLRRPGSDRRRRVRPPIVPPRDSRSRSGLARGPTREPFPAVPAALALSLLESQRVSSFSPPREGTKQQKEFSSEPQKACGPGADCGRGADPEAPSTLTSEPETRSKRCPGRAQQTRWPGGLRMAHRGIPGGSQPPAPPRALCPDQPGAGGRTHLLRSRRAHLAARPVAATQRRGRLACLPAPRPFLLRPGPAPQTRTENRPRARLTRGAPRPGALRPLPFLLLRLCLRLPRLARLPRPGAESPTLPGARLNPERRCPTAQGDTPKRGPR